MIVPEGGHVVIPATAETLPGSTTSAVPVLVMLPFVWILAAVAVEPETSPTVSLPVKAMSPETDALFSAKIA